MTAFAINSGGVEYYDQKTGGSVNATLDTYTISNGSTLIVRTDSYACANHSAAFGSIDNIAFSGIGGEVVIDPTYVRHVAFTGGSGNSPAFGAAISQGGVSGVFLGVWADWQSEPIVPGAAIPATGFIKIGGVAGGAFSAGALTGIVATCAGADVQSWIEVRSAETATISVPRVGKFSTVEAWLELGVTTGVAGQVIPCPTTATVAQVWGGAWIETAPGSNVYDRFWGAAGQVALSTTPTDIRAKQIWQTTAGLVLGFDGTNTVGFLPPAGCKIKIPAVILTNCTRSSGNGSGPRVLPHATIATRAEFITSLSGDIDLRGVVCQWYCNFVQPFALKILSAIISSTVVVSEVIGARINDCIVSAVQSQNSVTSLAASYCIDLKIEESSFSRFALSATGDNVFSLRYSESVEINRVFAQSLTDRTATTNAFSLSDNIQTLVDGCTQIGARLITQRCVNTTVRNCVHADRLVATTSANSQAAFHSVSSTNLVIENCGPIPGIENCQPYTSWVYVESCRGGVVKNFGTYAAPIDCGSANATAFGFDTFAAPQNLNLQRCYFVNTRTGLFSIANETNGVLIEHCYGDFNDTTTIDCLNAAVRSCGFRGSTSGRSSVYGTHWSTQFVSTVDGFINLMCNEPTAQTAGQCTVVSGAPKFNSSGSILMTVVGQQVVFEMPYFALGNTALANSAVALVGTNTANLTYEFQYDLGSGYNGAWLTANATNFTAVGAIDPAIGIKIKLRVTCTTANASNALTNIRITTVTTSTAQSTNLYPLDTITLTLTGLVSGSDVVVRAAGTSTILASVDSNAGTTWAYVYETPVAIDVDVIKPGYVPKPLLRNYTPSAQDSSLPVSQLLDRNYI
jgi:hypothetical protein